MTPALRTGGSFTLIAIGAILYFAVNGSQIANVDISTIGLILMIIGALAFLVSLISFFSQKSEVERYQQNQRPPGPPQQ